MAIRTWYRGIRFVKNFIAQYLNYIFMAGEKDLILFTDGTKAIKFSKTPIAMKRASWDFRQLPAVLVGRASGGLKYISFNKDKLLITQTEYVSGSTEANETTYYGGDFDITIGLSVRATTIEERDNLVDIVGIYLAHPDAKEYFGQHYLSLPEAPTIGSESDIHEPNLDHPIYATEMNLRVVSRWQEFISPEYSRLLDIIVDIEAELDFE